MVACSYCGKEAKLVGGDEIYPAYRDLWSKWFWYCKPCDAYVGCHKATRHNNFAYDIPLGTLANAELRQLRGAAHRAFDPRWKNGFMTRGAAYGWLSAALNIEVEKCHIGLFDEATCLKVLELCKEQT